MPANGPTISDDAHISFAKRLAHNNRDTRKAALKKVKRWLVTKSKQGTLDHGEIMKIWKGLHYSMWYSDKPLTQESLALDISQIVSLFPSIEDSVSFFSGFCETIAREWVGIDRQRLDKFYMFIKTALKCVLEFCAANSWNDEIVNNVVNTLDVRIINSPCPDSIAVFISENIFSIYSEICNDSTPPQFITKILGCYITVLSKTPKKDLSRVLIANLFTPIISNTIDLKIEHQQLISLITDLAVQPSILTRNRKLLYKLRNDIAEAGGVAPSALSPLGKHKREEKVTKDVVDDENVSLNNQDEITEPKKKKKKKKKKVNQSVNFLISEIHKTISVDKNCVMNLTESHQEPITEVQEVPNDSEPFVKEPEKTEEVPQEKKEEVTVEDEAEEVTAEDEAEVAVEDEGEEIAAEDEAEEIAAEDEAEEVAAEDEAEEVAAEDEAEEVTAEDEAEEVAAEDEAEVAVEEKTADAVEETAEVADEEEAEEVVSQEEITNINKASSELDGKKALYINTDDEQAEEAMKNTEQTTEEEDVLKNGHTESSKTDIEITASENTGAVSESTGNSLANGHKEEDKTESDDKSDEPLVELTTSKKKTPKSGRKKSTRTKKTPKKVTDEAMETTDATLNEDVKDSEDYIPLVSDPVVPSPKLTRSAKKRSKKSISKTLTSDLTSTPVASGDGITKKKVRLSIENNQTFFFKKNTSLESPKPFDSTRTPVKGVLKVSPALTRSQSRKKAKSRVKH